MAVIGTYQFEAPDRGLLALARSCKLLYRELEEEFGSKLFLSVAAHPHLGQKPQEPESEADWDEFLRLPRHCIRGRHISISIDLALDVRHKGEPIYLRFAKVFILHLRRAVRADKLRTFTFGLVGYVNFDSRHADAATVSFSHSTKNQEESRVLEEIDQLEQQLMNVDRANGEIWDRVCWNPYGGWT